MNELPILMAYMHSPYQETIEGYLKNGGYQAIKKALFDMQPKELIELVKNSELRGRGGAGFITGLKWGFIPKEAKERYLVCNADESEPGTFKDRLLMEKDPHQVIEGVILASFAIQAKKAFIYCRGEYHEAIQKLEKAVLEAKALGFLGKQILGTDFSLEIVIHPGAGAYIAGEETAQLNSLEGFPATPRLKPPFPAVCGLYGKPTIINNVETLCNVVHLVQRGLDWFKSIGKPKNTGTKIFQVSGHVQKPGCFEFPLGVTLEEVLEKAGGVLPGRSFKACYPGGSSCALLTNKDLSISMDFDTLAARNSALGTASLIVMDDTTNMVSVAHRLMQFYQNESCGKCTPCREGTRWISQMLCRLEKGEGTSFDLKVIEDVCHAMAAHSFCPLAAGASPPILSALSEFKNEFDEAVKRNPAGLSLPKMQISYPYLVK